MHFDHKDQGTVTHIFGFYKIYQPGILRLQHIQVCNSVVNLGTLVNRNKHSARW